MENHLEHSYWWVPGSPDTKVHGALSFDPVEGASLTLLDPLPGVRASRFNTPALLGETFDGKPLTLLHSFLAGISDRTTPTEWRSRSTIVAPAVLRGYHLENPDAPIIGRAVLRFAGLRDICLQEWPSDNGELISFVGPGLIAKQATLDGGVVLFRQCEDKTSDRYSKSSEIDIEADIAVDEPLSIADFDQRWITPLETLIVLTAHGPTQLGQFIVLVRDEHGAETEVEVDTHLHALAPKLPADYRPLVRLAALGEDALPFIGRWWQLYWTLGPAAKYLNAALSGDMFLEQKLLAGMSFVESYHRELHDDPVVPRDEHKRNIAAMLDALPNQARRNRYLALLQLGVQQSARERLELLIDRAKDTLPTVPGLDTTLAKELVVTRNAIAHLDRSISKALNGVDLIYAVARLSLVIQINLLLDLELEPNLAGSLVLTSYDRRMPIVDYREQESPQTAGSQATAPA
ncbi:MAG TPA: HEPN domain-containing protein [Solirubrobacteraceae bacterium]